MTGPEMLEATAARMRCPELVVLNPREIREEGGRRGCVLGNMSAVYGTRALPVEARDLAMEIAGRPFTTGRITADEAANRLDQAAFALREQHAVRGVTSHRELVGA